MLKNKLTRVKTKSLVTGLLAAWMSVTPIANASGPNEEPASDVSYTEGSQPAMTASQYVRSLDAAMDYSINNDGIGIQIVIAPDTSLTHENIGNGLVNRLKAEHDIDAQYTYSFADDGTTNVSFFVGGVPYAKYGLSAMPQGYNKAVTHYKNLKEAPSLVAGLD